MHFNNVCHFAIHADDVLRAKTFYEKVFGWRFEAWGPPDFYLIHTGDQQNPGIHGALQQRQQPVGTGFNGYECSISVEDVKKTEADILAHGAESWYDLLKSLRSVFSFSLRIPKGISLVPSSIS